MEIPQFSFDKNSMLGLLGKASAAMKGSVAGILAWFGPTREVPEDFATRPSIPTWEEYEAASNAQILDRLHRNPGGLLNEQPFIDTLMHVRSAENQRKQTRYLILGFFVFAFSAFALAFKTPPAPPAPPPVDWSEQQRNTDKAINNAVELLKQEFNLKLQGKDQEIRDLKRQISLLNQAQGELNKEIKSLARTAAASARPQAIPKSAPAPAKPQEPPKPAPTPQAPAHPKPPKSN